MHGADTHHRYGGVMAERERTSSPLTSAVTPPARRTRLALAVDIGLILLCAGPTVGRPLASRGSLSATEAFAVVATTVLIWWRHRAPVPAFVAGAIVTVVVTSILQAPSGVLPALIVLVYTAALTVDRRRGIIIGSTALVVMIIGVAVLVQRQFFGPEVLAALAWPALAVAAADAVRSRRATLDAAEERVRRAEQTREHEARRRVAEERLRIARELHDVVAHRMAVVNVQAGVAAHLLRSQPDAAEAALGVVRSSASTVLDELSGILNVLRSADDDGSSLEPTPSLDELPALIDSFASAGLSVDVTTSGQPRPLAEHVQLAVYRTVQEALTNAHKYGDGAASLSIAHGPTGVDVRVTNRSVATSQLGTGYGLIGMRERVAAAGGSLATGPQPDGTFLVHATFPSEAT
jgi:signal transduction histidine kinase